MRSGFSSMHPKESVRMQYETNTCEMRNKVTWLHPAMIITAKARPDSLIDPYYILILSTFENRHKIRITKMVDVQYVGGSLVILYVFCLRYLVTKCAPTFKIRSKSCRTPAPPIGCEEQPKILKSQSWLLFASYGGCGGMVILITKWVYSLCEFPPCHFLQKF